MLEGDKDACAGGVGGEGSGFESAKWDVRDAGPQPRVEDAYLRIPGAADEGEIACEGDVCGFVRAFERSDHGTAGERKDGNRIGAFVDDPELIIRPGAHRGGFESDGELGDADGKARWCGRDPEDREPGSG